MELLKGLIEAAARGSCSTLSGMRRPSETALHSSAPQRPQTSGISPPPAPVTLGVSSEILKRYLLLFGFVYFVPLGLRHDSHAHWAQHVETRVPGVPEAALVGTEVWAVAEREAREWRGMQGFKSFPLLP